MQTSKKCFTDVFNLYTPPEELDSIIRDSAIIKVNIDSRTYSLTAVVDFKNELPLSALAAIEQGLSSCYSLSSASVIPYTGRDFDVSDTEKALGYLKFKRSSVNGFFTGSSYKLKDNILEINTECSTLPFPSADAERIISEYISLRYDNEIKVKIIKGNGIDAESFDSSIEKDLQKALTDQPQISSSAPTRAVKSEPQKKESVKRDFRKKTRASKMHSDRIIFGNAFGDPLTKLSDINAESGYVCVAGTVFFVEKRELRDGQRTVLSVDITDKTSSVRIKKILNAIKDAEILDAFQTGIFIYVRGEIKNDRFENDIVLTPTSVMLGDAPEKHDNADIKRVELHLHTQMSAMDAVSSAESLITQAYKWGHSAIAITDHGVAQAYPEALKTAKKLNYKIIYGCEGYYINNLEDVPIITGSKSENFDGDFVCFDIETTGTNRKEDGITEIAASLVRDGVIIDNFHTFVNPGQPISPFITELTGITNGMVADAPSQENAVKMFLEFTARRIVVAHNAAFDTGFIQKICDINGIEYDLTSIDTLSMARILLPHLERHRLNTVAEALKLPKFKHHSAVDDAKILALMFIKLLKMCESDHNVTDTVEMSSVLNDLRRENAEKQNNAKSLPVHHILLLVKNQAGLKNLYKLISMAHLTHMNSRKQPIIPRNLLSAHRKGLLVGSACSSGELYSAILDKKDWKELLKIAKYYDFLEIQPIGNNNYLLTGEDGVKDRSELEENNKTIIRLGDTLGIPVVATGDVHFKDPEDEVFRRILQAGKGYTDADTQAPLYLRTTEEMLAEFTYLPAQKAFEVVVTNTNKIADICDLIKPLPSKMYAPVIENSAEDLKHIVLKKAYSIYGDPLPDPVKSRIERELGCIISNSYDVMYMTAQKLIKGSNDRGYIVGSRGSVGSSVVAYMAGITEVNSLPAHYICPHCYYSDFDLPLSAIGADLPDKNCPVCGDLLKKDGFNIPFETFLGFNGDKVPDIDLNFSGEDQANAHNQTIELFGKENVFRAGTIGTIAEKTAYGYVKKYNDERGVKVSKAEENRLILGCTGVKRTTGQHPGGMIVVPRTSEIYDFCAIQHPADDINSDTITTHIDYHTMEDNLLKFDILGHDDPTMIKMMTDITGVNANDIPLDDKKTLSLYSSYETLNIPHDDIVGETGTIAIPEFGTKFVRQMLVDTQPQTISELVKISGLSHGTDVWLDNAKDLITGNITDINGIICCRDDIMLYLISMGVDPKLSFTIMEGVRKGKKLNPDWEQAMRACSVPEWYIDSCNKIKYLFPKAHAAAYVVMGFRIAYFKVYYPLAFYAAYFTIRASALDAETMLAGDSYLVSFIKKTEADKDSAAIDQDLAKTFEVAHEYYLRGFEFMTIDLYKSDPLKFIIEDGKLRMPFVALRGLGESAALSICSEREKDPFLSVEEMISRCKVSRPAAELMQRIGILGDLPMNNQISFLA